MHDMMHGASCIISSSITLWEILRYVASILHLDSNALAHMCRCVTADSEIISNCHKFQTLFRFLSNNSRDFNAERLSACLHGAYLCSLIERRL